MSYRCRLRFLSIERLKLDLYHMTLGEQIRQARKSLAWTQAELAGRCGVTERTIQRIEKGEVRPSAYTLGKLIDLLALEQPMHSSSQPSTFGELFRTRFYSKNKTKLLLMATATLLFFLAFSWFTAPLAVREGMEEKVTLSTINCESKASACDLQLTVLDDTGKIQLQKTYGGTSYDKASAVLPISDGGYLLLGSTSSFGAGNYDILLIKVDASGKQLWQQTYGGFFNEYAKKMSLTDGILTIEGSQQTCPSPNDFSDCILEKWTFDVDLSGNLVG